MPFQILSTKQSEVAEFGITFSARERPPAPCMNETYTACNECLAFRDAHLALFTFMHLADAFIQNDLQCIQAIHFLSVCKFL